MGISVRDLWAVHHGMIAVPCSCRLCYLLLARERVTESEVLAAGRGPHSTLVDVSGADRPR